MRNPNQKSNVFTMDEIANTTMASTQARMQEILQEAAEAERLRNAAQDWLAQNRATVVQGNAYAVAVFETNGLFDYIACEEPLPADWRHQKESMVAAVHQLGAQVALDGRTPAAWCVASALTETHEVVLVGFMRQEKYLLQPFLMSPSESMWLGFEELDEIGVFKGAEGWYRSIERAYQRGLNGQLL